MTRDDYDIIYSGTLDRQGLCGHTSSYMGGSSAKMGMEGAEARLPRHPPRHEPRQPYSRRKSALDRSAGACDRQPEGWLF